MHLLNPGDRVVAVADVYGGVYRMFSQVYEPKGYAFDWVPADEVNTNLAEHLDERTRMVWLETPTNPLLNIVDIRAAAEAAHAVGALVVVDNTFASPYLQQPLELGADVVVHSTTKYLGGHSDLIGGFVATNDPTVAERLYFLQKSLGAVPGPFDSWLVLRGLKTLAVRMREHCENAAGGRRASSTRHPKVEKVLYPGLPTHPGPRDRRAADARLRRDGLVPGRVGGGGGRDLRAHEDLPARREPRRRREPDRASGADDARLDRRRAVRGAAATSCGSRSGSSRRRTWSPTSRPRSSARRRPPAPDACRGSRSRRRSTTFLRLPNPAVVATLRPDGSPHTVPTWYDWEDGRVLLNMEDTRLRLSYLRRDPRAALTVLGSGEDGWYRHVSLLGRVVSIADDESLEDIDRLALRYTGRPFRKRDMPRVSAWLEPERWHGWS